MPFQIRNVTRLIWINVSVPPADDASRGKFPNATLTPTQLRRRKVDAIKLSLCFAYAVKHYLRGEDGLDVVRAVSRTALRLLRPGGLVVVEHGDSQGPEMTALLRADGWTAVATHQDLTRRDRATTGLAPLR